MTLDELLRKVVPSVPVLARTPLGFFLDFADYFIKKRHPEWAQLPPASLRMRIGVGNQILRNHKNFVRAGENLVDELSEKGYLTPTSRVLELGCGCGRNSIAISRFLGGGAYVGQDVDKEMIEWCKKNLQTKRVQFHHADIYSRVYNPKGKSINEYQLPLSDHSIDLIISVSVFSHLIHGDFLYYIQECARVLARGGHLHMTLFLLDFLKPQQHGNRWSFSHKLDRCYIENLKYPEAAVAYHLDTIQAMLPTNGFCIEEIYYRDRGQQTLILKKQAIL